MSIKALVPMVVTDKQAALKEFYTRYFGFQVIFEHPAYLGLRAKGAEGEIELGFLAASDEHPPFSGQGVILALKVDDVDAEYERLLSEGVIMTREPTDNPWGDRSCMCLDPAGLALYLYKPIPPAAEFASAVKG